MLCPMEHSSRRIREFCVGWARYRDLLTPPLERLSCKGEQKLAWHSLAVSSVAVIPSPASQREFVEI